MRTVRDLIGDPSSWENRICDGADPMPDMVGATVLDTFDSGNQLAIYARNPAGVESLSIFFIDDAKLRGRIANALAPGSDVHKAIAIAIE